MFDGLTGVRVDGREHRRGDDDVGDLVVLDDLTQCVTGIVGLRRHHERVAGQDGRGHLDDDRPKLADARCRMRCRGCPPAVR